MDIRKWYPELEEEGWVADNMLAALQRLIKEQHAKDKAERIAEWRVQLEENEDALIRWIKADAGSAVAEEEEEPHVQKRARQIEARLSELWTTICRGRVRRSDGGRRGSVQRVLL